jgi:hypothetical protein
MNALIGTEGERVFVAEVRDLQKHAAALFPSKPVKRCKIVCTGHIAAPVSADLG